jgi:hypothetical protein
MRTCQLLPKLFNEFEFYEPIAAIFFDNPGSLKGVGKVFKTASRNVHIVRNAAIGPIADQGFIHVKPDTLRKSCAKRFGKSFLYQTSPSAAATSFRMGLFSNTACVSRRARRMGSLEIGGVNVVTFSEPG